MKYTTHYNLNKPEGPDLFNVEHFNENSTIIDNALFGISQDITPMSSHISNQNNPHNVTKAQVGLGNVDNTSDLNKPVSTAVQTELNKKANSSTLSTVATSGSYNDLTNKPVIISYLSALNDVLISSPTDGQALLWNDNISTWVNGNVSVSPTIIDATLAANNTSVTISNIPTSGDYIIDFYISDGSNYTAINTSVSGQVTLTYEASSSSRTVRCVIREV